MVGGAIAAGALLSGYGVWLYKKSSERSSGWGGSDTELTKVEGEIQRLKRQMGFDPTPAETRKMRALKAKAAKLYAR
jgi:hypothetical protein